MDAVLLAAGKGTRLRPLTVNRPKPLVPVANNPILKYQLMLLEKAGCDRVFVPVEYLADQIINYIQSIETDLSFEFTYDNLSLGTAGAVSKIADHLKGTFLVISGDLLVDVDLCGMMESHLRNKASVTIGLTNVEDPTHYGIALMEGARICQFLEKPDPSKIFSDIINAGIYVLDPGVLKEVPPGVPFDFSNDLFPKIIKDHFIAGYLMGGYWNDIGRPSRYLQANGDALLGRFPLHKFVQDFTWKEGMTPVMGRKSRIGKVEISCPVLLGENCLVEEGSILRSFVILGDNVSLGKDSCLDGVVIHDGVRIGPSTNLNKCIVGRNCVIDHGVELAEGTVIGDDTKIGPNCRIGSNMKIWSGSTLGANTIIVPD